MLRCQVLLALGDQRQRHRRHLCLPALPRNRRKYPLVHQRAVILPLRTTLMYLVSLAGQDAGASRLPLRAEGARWAAEEL